MLNKSDSYSDFYDSKNTRLSEVSSSDVYDKDLPNQSEMNYSRYQSVLATQHNRVEVLIEMLDESENNVARFLEQNKVTHI